MSIPGFCYCSEEMGKPGDILREGLWLAKPKGLVACLKPEPLLFGVRLEEPSSPFPCLFSYPLPIDNPSEIRKEPRSGNTSPHLTRLNREQLTAYKYFLESLILTRSLQGSVPVQGGEEATSFLILPELLPLRDCSTLN